MRRFRRFCVTLLVLVGTAVLTLSAPFDGPATAAAACVSSTGPGIPPPATVPSGGPGLYRSSWYGQSGYMTLCVGDTATATVAIYNSGVAGWSRGGWAAMLGTWSPTPGQDQPSALGGDGSNGSPNTGWPRYNRVAIQPASWVGPNQVAWFQFQVRAPSTPGTYRLYIRPLVEGAVIGGVSGQWMDDQGIFWQITVVGSTDHGAPTVSATGERPNIRLAITEPSANVDGLNYSIQRSASLSRAPVACDSTTGPYGEIATVTIPSGSNIVSYVDANRPDGIYCYRVGAPDPVPGTTDFGYSNPAVLGPPLGP
jgi:hypothetical protein